MDQEHSKQTPRDFCDSDGMCTSSLKEISLIETVTSFLEENGAAEVDPRVLKNLAEALSKRIDTDATSPSGLNDVTMENSYTSFDAARAPGGIHSPMQGRSVRELEEQMSTLRKENFNLKLRIYFMEEGQHGARGAKNAADSPTKQLIDSKIEIEILRKRVEDKTELLKDAARAISQHEDMQKKADMESQAMIEQMQQYIHQLEAAAKLKATKKSIDALNAEKFKTLEAEVLKLENALLEADLRETESRRQQELLANDLADRQETLVACEAKIEELAIKNAGLLEQLEKQTETDQLATQTISRQKLELSACLTENGRLLSELTATEHEMQCQNKWIGDAVTVLDVQRKTIKVMEDMNNEKDRAHRRLYMRLNEYENLIRRQSFEVDMVRRKKQFFQNLSQKLQYKDRLHCLERIAIVQPMRCDKFRDLGSCASGCSYRTNFSAISILFGHPDLSSVRQVRKLYLSMPEHCRVATMPLSVAAPSTAFYNYSLPPFNGLRELLCRWCWCVAHPPN